MPAKTIQRRRKIGRQYLRIYGWVALAANCVVLVLLARRYFAGGLAGNMALHYAAGIVAGLIVSIILIWAAKSR